ncbi:MAG: hypothetical protein K2W33_00055 [Burkholderiales bacterium]|nr:hypothetical protein [Burkholderiales bacterium]
MDSIVCYLNYLIANNISQISDRANFDHSIRAALLRESCQGHHPHAARRRDPRHISRPMRVKPDCCARARAYGGVAVKVTLTVRPARPRALLALLGSVIELMLRSDVITTRGMLAAITWQALMKSS